MYFNTISRTGAVPGVNILTSAESIARAFLQQAVDHDLRLTAFSFMLRLPYREAMSEYRSLILRLHIEVRLR